MGMLTVAAPAKINLRLRIGARDDSGYHELETVFCALDLADQLEVELAGTEGIRLEAQRTDLGPPEQNLVYRAASVFRAETRLAAGVRIRLSKQVPTRAGLGGGSSDAAATLLALNRLHGEPLGRQALLRLAAGLGSDVPFFLCGSPLALGRGRGEQLMPLPPLPAAPVLLAIPSFGMGTAEAYRTLDEKRRGLRLEREAKPLDPGELGSWDAVAARAANDFEPVIFRRFPELAAAKAALAASGARMALLAGSGAAVFGVYRSAAERDAAAAELRGRFPAFTAMPTMTARSATLGGTSDADT